MTETFAIVPSQGKAMWVIIAFVGIVLGAVLTILVLSLRGAHGSRFEVSEEGLRLRGDIWGRRIPASAIKGGEARLVDFTASPELRPNWRTAGTALGSYNSGWFRLKNGEKALLYLTTKTQVAYVPTTEGYSLLLSPQDPERFITSVKDIARGQ